MQMSNASLMPTASAQPVAWRLYQRRAVVVYLWSRVCVVAGASIVGASDRTTGPRSAELPLSRTLGEIARVLTSWDGAWYYKIVRSGYPSDIPSPITYEMSEARAAFFPVFPLVVRAVDLVMPGGDVLAGIIVNFLLGALAVLLVGVLARQLFGDRAGYRTMVLMAIFPGSVALSLTYSEATLIVLAAACILMLLRERWLFAGVLAAIGTATRPNGLALAAACIVAAYLAIKQRSDWSSLVAPVLAPVGFVAFQLYLRVRTGEWAWFRVQTEAWDEGTSYGYTAVKNTLEAFTHPLSSPTDVLTAVSVIVMSSMIWAMCKRRLPWPMVAFVAVVLLLMVLPSTVTARPRFLYTAFPAFISVAAWWPEEHEEAWSLTIALCTAGLVTLTGLYGVLGAIP